MAVKVPAFMTNCEHETYLSGGVWYIVLKTSGTFALRYSKTHVDIFLQGGGGGGAYGTDRLGGGGGAGGYQTTVFDKEISTDQYIITIGEGGPPQTVGGKTLAFGYSAEGGGYGGDTGNSMEGSQNGTGSGGTGGWYNSGVNWGGPGGNGEDGALAFGVGDVYYGAGGGGGGAAFERIPGAGGKTGGGAGGENGLPNTGGGGGGGQGYVGSGGSGVVILRGTQDDQLPVKFDGVTLQRILYDGEEVMHLIHDGTKIFMERMRRWLGWSRRKTLSPLPVS